MKFLETLAGKAQALGATIGDLDERWLALAVLAILLGVIIFALDKPQSMMWLLILYAVLFIAFQIPSLMKKATAFLSKDDLRYAELIVGALPIIAIGVLKFKRKRK